jgi:hypothetical protein
VLSLLSIILIPLLNASTDANNALVDKIQNDPTDKKGIIDDFGKAETAYGKAQSLSSVTLILGFASILILIAKAIYFLACKLCSGIAKLYNTIRDKRIESANQKLVKEGYITDESKFNVSYTKDSILEGGKEVEVALETQEALNKNAKNKEAVAGVGAYLLLNEAKNDVLKIVIAAQSEVQNAANANSFVNDYFSERKNQEGPNVTENINFAPGA